MTEWYLVKTNWKATIERCPFYAGIGGDIWPLDECEDREARTIHSAVMDSRQYVDLAAGAEFVCMDQNIARRYAHVTKKLVARGTRVWLLRVGVPATAEGPWDGVDIGNASGGYSLIESEMIPSGRIVLLNEKGLFPDEAAASRYLSARSDADGEEADSLEMVGVAASAI